MNQVEQLEAKYPELEFVFTNMSQKFGGLIVGNRIIIDKNRSVNEQAEIMIEEIGHYKTSVGNISDYTSYANMKQENEARTWGIEHLVPESSIDYFKKKKYDDDFEVADELGIKITYLHEAGEIYKIKGN